MTESRRPSDLEWDPQRYWDCSHVNVKPLLKCFAGMGHGSQDKS